MAVNNLEVKLISECFIKPKFEVKESKTPYYLLGEDLKWLSIRYSLASFIFTKPTTNDFNMNVFVDKMKVSLSQALVYYYPLAGRLTIVRYEDEQACSVHVDCNKGPGARFIHASLTGTTMSDIINRRPPAIRYIVNLGETSLVNYDGHTHALLSLQVTELEDGIVLGFAINHCMADGKSIINFVSSLSEIFMSKNDDETSVVPLSNMPVFKPYLPDGCSLIQKLPYLEIEKFISRVDNDPRLSERIFHFSSSSVAKLKERANLELGVGPRKITSFQALAALVWISINRARKLPAQAITVCLPPIDCRLRFNPPLSPNHFGNLAQPLAVAKSVGELLENGLGWASMMLNQDISGYGHEAATQYLKGSMENPTIVRLDEDDILKMNLVNFTWASKFDVYGIDFGIGKVTSCTGANNDKRDGMVVVMRGREGGGSIDLEISLLRDNMNALESDKDFMSYVS